MRFLAVIRKEAAQFLIYYSAFLLLNWTWAVRDRSARRGPWNSKGEPRLRDGVTGEEGLA